MPNQGGNRDRQPMKQGQQAGRNEGQRQAQQAPGRDQGGEQRAGGKGSLADRERAAEAGRKGGKH